MKQSEKIHWIVLVLPIQVHPTNDQSLKWTYHNNIDKTSGCYGKVLVRAEVVIHVGVNTHYQQFKCN